ncbi:MAG: (2Fe-2S) ferredoxin domain-containing protein [Oscillospiraceae bacterium]|nr:(2Fe-2S) ferredoxin domain-containing protein [Oscillospiraceae bacterium]
MKTLEELAQLREQMKAKMAVRTEEGKLRVVVGMATCGIAAGARPVLNTLAEEVSKENLTDKVSVSQTGCIGICQFEPVVEVFDGDSKVTYVKMTPDKAKRVVAEHLKGGNVVQEYTIGSSKV